MPIAQLPLQQLAIGMTTMYLCDSCDVSARYLASKTPQLIIGDLAGSCEHIAVYDRFAILCHNVNVAGALFHIYNSDIFVEEFTAGFAHLDFSY